MDIRKVKKLIELLEESGIAEIEISEGEESVRISRYPQGQPAPFMHYAAPPAPMQAAPAPAQIAAPPAAAAPAAVSKLDHTVTAPMVARSIPPPRQARNPSSTSAVRSTSAIRSASSKP